MIFDGSSFGTATPAGSDEEADYLGIPGLLDAGQMRDLLRRTPRRAARKAHRLRRAGPAPSATHGQLRDLRRELNTLVSIAHHRTGKPHGWIHNELRRICGGPPIAAATTDQLKERITAVRTLGFGQTFLIAAPTVSQSPISSGRSATESMTKLGCIANSSAAQRSNVS